MKKLSPLLISLLLLVGCEKLEFSPYQSFDSNTPQNINPKNIQKLLSQSDTSQRIRIAFVGDSQRFYEGAEAFVKKANQLHDIDFVILAGDISDFGMKNEFEWVHQILSKLNVPYITVIGNHDYQGRGEEVYKRMYGPYNFSFVYKKAKFVFHDTNSRERKFNGATPDMNWLDSELRTGPGVSYLIPVSHVPPYDGDFDKSLEMPYARLMSERNVAASLHGHIHVSNDFYPYQDSVRYINSNALNRNEFLLLDIQNGNIQKHLIRY